MKPTNHHTHFEARASSPANGKDYVLPSPPEAHQPPHAAEMARLEREYSYRPWNHRRATTTGEEQALRCTDFVQAGLAFCAGVWVAYEFALALADWAIRHYLNIH